MSRMLECLDLFEVIGRVVNISARRLVVLDYEGEVNQTSQF